MCDSFCDCQILRLAGLYDILACYYVWTVTPVLLPPAYAVEVMFSSCLCVCVSVCLSVCVSVQAITFEPVDIETSFFGVVVHIDNI